jgi:hypothetical protein
MNIDQQQSLFIYGPRLIEVESGINDLAVDNENEEMNKRLRESRGFYFVVQFHCNHLNRIIFKWSFFFYSRLLTQRGLRFMKVKGLIFLNC